MTLLAVLLFSELDNWKTAPHSEAILQFHIMFGQRNGRSQGLLEPSESEKVLGLVVRLEYSFWLSSQSVFSTTKQSESDLASVT